MNDKSYTCFLFPIPFSPFNFVDYSHHRGTEATEIFSAAGHQIPCVLCVSVVDNFTFHPFTFSPFHFPRHHSIFFLETFGEVGWSGEAYGVGYLTDTLVGG